MDMPLEYINNLYLIARDRQLEELKQQQEKEKNKDSSSNNSPGMTSAQAIALEDELEAALT